MSLCLYCLFVCNHGPFSGKQHCWYNDRKSSQHCPPFYLLRYRTWIGCTKYSSCLALINLQQGPVKISLVPDFSPTALHMECYHLPSGKLDFGHCTWNVTYTHIVLFLSPFDLMLASVTAPTLSRISAPTSAYTIIVPLRKTKFSVIAIITDARTRRLLLIFGSTTT